MKGRIKELTEEDFRKACSESLSMARAAAALGLHFDTFKKYAQKYGLYKTNQSGRGINKNIRPRVNKIEEYATRSSVRSRIIKENLIPYKCNECGINEWNKKELSLHLDHINGNCWDHRLENLRFLCPNCHSQTPNYTGRNK